jgi:hypothetical protein
MRMTPHIFQGREDRDCTVCGYPDRNSIHKIPRTFTIIESTPISLDVRWLQGVIYHALNQPGVDGYHVDITDATTLTITKDVCYSEIAITGAAFEELQRIAKKQGLTVAQMTKAIEENL